MSISPIATDPATPKMDKDDKARSLLPTASTPLEIALAGATAKLEPIPTPLSHVWDVEHCPDEILPFLAYAWSVDEWNDAWTDAVKRSVIRESLWVHERKGTLGAVKRALSAMSYDTEVIEWWQKSPQGTAGTFSIAVRPTTGFIADNIHQIRAVIDAVKRLSAHYDIYVDIGVATAHVHATGVSVSGVVVRVST